MSLTSTPTSKFNISMSRYNILSAFVYFVCFVVKFFVPGTSHPAHSGELGRIAVCLVPCDKLDSLVDDAPTVRHTLIASLGGARR